MEDEMGEAEVRASDICTEQIRRMGRNDAPTALLSSCVNTISELLVKAPDWVGNVKNVREIIDSLDGRLKNADWPGLTALHGKTVEWTQTASYEEGKVPASAMAPPEIIHWLNEVLDATHAVYGIPNDRTHVNLLAEGNGEHSTSRVSVGKLLDKYDAPPEIRKLMTMLPSKSTQDRIQIEISTDPADVLRKSTGQFWTSCETAGGAYCSGNFTDIEQKNAIAIIRKNKDIDTKGKWAARFMLRSCKADDGQVDVGVEPRVYGDTKLEREALKKMKEFLLEQPEHYTAYSYCYTPYEYMGYSDTMGQQGVIVYGNHVLAVKDIFEKQIAEVREKLDYESVCKRQYPRPSESPYYEGNLADLYEQMTRDILEENDSENAVGYINQSSFEEVTGCVLDYNLDDYQRWKRADRTFKEVMEKLAKVFENDVYAVGGKHEAFDRESSTHLFAPGCEASYNRNSYIVGEQWTERFEDVQPLLDSMLRDADQWPWMGEYSAALKATVVEHLNPWNDHPTNAELLDVEKAKGPFSSEDISRYCYELESKDREHSVYDRKASVGLAFTNLGFTDEGYCPIESAAMGVMKERCRIRAELRLPVRGGGTEIFSSEQEVMSLNDRSLRERGQNPLDDIIARTPINDVDSERARNRFIDDLLDQRRIGAITGEQFAERMQAYDNLPERYD